MDSFLEDVNNLLNIGEIPNLITKDEVDEFLDIYRGSIRDWKDLS